MYIINLCHHIIWCYCVRFSFDINLTTKLRIISFNNINKVA